MKRLLFLFILCCASLSVYAQKISFDKIYEDNSRGISCTSETCRNFSDRVILSVALGAVTDQESVTKYNVTLLFSELASATEDFSIPDNATLLIRTSDDAVIEAKCEKGETDYFGDIIRVGNTLANMKTVSTIAYVSAEDVDHLSTGIVKVRCHLNSSQLNKEYYENSFKKAKLADYFKKAKTIIDSALCEKKNGNITDGF